MPPAAPRIDAKLVAALRRLDDERRPIADAHRRLGAVAREIGIPAPSYEQTRLLVHQLRRQARLSTHAGELLLDIALQKRPPETVVELFMP